jgi:cytoskeletal protein CcmA (bactofilin family)
MEYAAAKSTLCRQCGRYFDIAEPQEAKAVGTREAVLPGEAQNLLRRFEGLWNRKHSTAIHCFECRAEQEISLSASSTICPACSADIDLRDYKITTSFSRNIRTHGTIYVSASGDLSSNTVVCHSAVIKGKLRGSLHCVGDVEFKGVGRIPGKLTASRVIIDKKANVQFFRQLQVGSLEIRGSMSGEIVAETSVLIRKNGLLDGIRIAQHPFGGIMGAELAANFEIDLGVRHHPGLQAFFGRERRPNLVNGCVDHTFRHQPIFTTAFDPGAEDKPAGRH